MKWCASESEDMAKHQKYRITAIVPMRHDSERVPGKNYRKLCGKPLYHHIVSSLLACPLLDEVVIDTDSCWIIEDARQHFPRVTILERPEHLRAGTISMNEVLLNSLRQLKADFVLQTHSTNPLLTSGTMERAVKTFLKNLENHDSLFSVTRLQKRLWDADSGPVNHDPRVLLRTQDLPPIYEENSCLYLFSPTLLENRCNRIGENPFLFEMDPLEAWDIDEETDFLVAECLCAARNRQR